MTINQAVVALSITLAIVIFGGSNAYATTEQTKDKTKKEVPTVVTVVEGDTLSKIADEHDTTYVRIFNANDTIANPDVIDVGDTLRIPNNSETLPDRYGEIVTVAQSVVAAAPQAIAASSAPAAQPSTVAAQPQAYSTASAGNTYAWGNCTWYVKNRKPNIPNSFGNAYEWIGRAQAMGYATGSNPAPGAIGVSGNHVVYVESVSNGMAHISEMNYGGGLGVVNYRSVSLNSHTWIYA
ncbi:LysM peptidoglycan-binding domain-containing protein [Candidatus Saccharibacteria bacterium]|nr:LysM peptidoglycan-binding domain-containing protein [Candidatus Saccharibacteria bacterium]